MTQNLLLVYGDELIDGAAIATRRSLNWAVAKLQSGAPLDETVYAGIPVTRTVDVETGRVEGELYGTQTTFPEGYAGSYQDYAPPAQEVGLKRVEIATNIGLFDAGQVVMIPEEDERVVTHNLQQGGMFRDFLTRLPR